MQTQTVFNNIFSTIYIKQNVFFFFSFCRTIFFALQGIVISWVEILAVGQRIKMRQDMLKDYQLALPSILKLLECDAANISSNFYPSRVLWPENVFVHFLRFPLLLVDTFFVSKRRLQNHYCHFSRYEIKDRVDIPKYFQRNFHFQTDGYFSKKSAFMYEHQVEILFAGTADAMRRLILKPMKQHFKNQGENLRFLEVGAGTGRLTRFIALAFPKSQITIVDLSADYLQQAQINLSEFKNISYLQGNAEHLPIKDQTYDAVFSCFLLHELPCSARSNVIQESVRVLKTEGFYGHVDSIQKGDNPDFDWIVDQFPIDFHEPFYEDYAKDNLKSYLEQNYLSSLKSEIGFFSKVFSGIKKKYA